jgi:hypothetical protein
MSKKVPYKSDYKLVERNELVSKAILWMAVLVTISILIISSFKSLCFSGAILQLLNNAGCFLSVSYFISDLVANYLFQLAEAKRREDFFDNSLNTQLSEENSENYFSNENLNYGITKMGVNSFENVFFSKSISRKMLVRMVVKMAIVLFLFLFLAIFMERTLIVIALQLALPFTIILQTIRLFLFHKRMEDIFRHYQSIFSSASEEKRDYLIIRNMTYYETVLSWACIKLDSKTFESMNERLSAQWEDLKVKFKIT